MNINFSLLFVSSIELLATNFLVYFLHEAAENGDCWLTEMYEKEIKQRQIHKKFNNFVKIFYFFLNLCFKLHLSRGKFPSVDCVTFLFHFFLHKAPLVLHKIV